MNNSHYHKDAKDEINYTIRRKPITTTKKTPSVPQERDMFETPRYATELLLPYIPKNIKAIWECAAGNRRIANVFEEKGYTVFATDIRGSDRVAFGNFLEDSPPKEVLQNRKNVAIVTNPPFSIKELFVLKAMEYGIPFAFLINADYSGQQIKWIKDYGCEKIIPNRRINFIPPNILNRIYEGESWETMQKNEPQYKKIKLAEAKEKFPIVFKIAIDKYGMDFYYKSVDSVPQNLLAKYSAAQFHSMWLTWGFNLGKTETFVELSNISIKTNIV